MTHHLVSGPPEFLCRFDPVDGLFEFANVFAREFSGFGELRHHRQRAAPEEAEDFIQQTMAGGITRDQRFKNVRVSDLLVRGAEPSCVSSRYTVV